MERTYYVYIMASDTKVIYIGMTNNLIRRVYEHKHNLIDGYTKKYRIKKLVYYDYGSDVYGVIEREKQIKRWRREKKIKLIEEMNSNWRDLYDELF